MLEINEGSKVWGAIQQAPATGSSQPLLLPGITMALGTFSVFGLDVKVAASLACDMSLLAQKQQQKVQGTCNHMNHVQSSSQCSGETTNPPLPCSSLRSPSPLPP
jgi:hypothetical protein